MPTVLTYSDIGLRIGLTAIAAAAIGFDRSVEGRPAGVKTTMLAALTACLAMLGANWPLDTVGKAPNSFVTLDLMRLPLGILTGVDFIGGGAILKRDGDVIGLTTASTLWFVTVIGLCFGAELYAFGLVGAAVGLAILRGVQPIEQRLREQRIAELTIKWRSQTFDPAVYLTTIASAGPAPSRIAMKSAPVEGVQELQCAVRRLSLPGEHKPPVEIAALAQHPDVLEWSWKE